MKKILVVALVAVVLAIVGVAAQARSSTFDDVVSWQMDQLGDVLDRLADRIDRLADYVDRMSDRADRDRDRDHERRREVHRDVEHVRSHQSSEESFRWSGRVAAGEAVEVKGVNGRIVAEAVGGEQVEVEAVKSGRRSDPGEVRIEVVEHSGGVTICAVYPTRRGENTCSPGSGGRMEVRDNDVDVDFTVRIPEGVRFVGRTVNGDVEAVSLRSDVEAASVNGSIEIGTTRSAQASTVNGSIQAAMGGEWEGPLEFNTVNGSITLDVPDGLDADVDARWVSGGITSDLPLTMQGAFGSRHARGTIGSGGPLLKLSTVNGEIRIRNGR